MTIDYYNRNAKEYFEHTKDTNMQVVYDEFESKIIQGAFILDLGCGSGRDSKHFLQKGYEVEAIDGSIEMCKIASKYINKKVKCIKFEDVNDVHKYDAIWASASLLHVPYNNLILLCNNLFKALKNGGVFYASFKYGNTEHIDDGKFYNDMDEEKIGLLLKGLTEIKRYEVFYNYEKRTKVMIQKWINVIVEII